MSIRRAPLKAEQPFTTFANTLLNDKTISAESLGMLVYLVSKPPNWSVKPGVVGERFGCGRDKVYRILNDLIAAGYASREAERNSAGKITGWNYLVSNEKDPLPENPEVDAEPLPENTTSGKSAPQKKDSKTKERKDSRPADDVYSEDFQALWQQAAQLGAPRTRNTSKKKAYDNWRMLNVEKQEQVRGAIPVFAAAMRAEGRPEDKIPHFEFWLSKRIYETVSAQAGSPAAKAALVDWHKTAKREQWIKVLPHWRANYSWNPVWGPAPGKPGCMLPEDLLTELEKYQIILGRDGRKAAEAAMSDASQLRDAINAAHRAA